MMKVHKLFFVFLLWGSPFFAFAQGDVADIRVTIRNIVDFGVGAVFFVSLIALVFAGYLYLTSAGSAEASGRAKTLILSSIIGIIIASLSFLILNLFSEQFVSFDTNPLLPSEDNLEPAPNNNPKSCQCGYSITGELNGDPQYSCVKNCVDDLEVEQVVYVGTGDTCIPGTLSKLQCDSGDDTCSQVGVDDSGRGIFECQPQAQTSCQEFQEECDNVSKFCCTEPIEMRCINGACI